MGKCLYIFSVRLLESVSNITDVYGHIDAEIEADVVTKNMGRLTSNGFDMDSDVAVGDS